MKRSLAVTFGAAALIVAGAGVGLSLAGEFDDPPDAAFDTAAVRDLADRASKLTTDEQLGLVRRLRRGLSKTLLTPSDEAWKGYEDLRDRTDAGVTRILQRGLYAEGDLLGRGGGCYFSFTKRSHDYGQHPQVELQRWKFSTGFYGGAGGMVLTVPGSDVRTVSEDTLPAACRADAGTVVSAGRNDRSEADEAAVGKMYAVRAISNDQFDVLAVFQVLAKDDHGVTIAWRVLRTWDPPKRAR